MVDANFQRAGRKTSLCETPMKLIWFSQLAIVAQNYSSGIAYADDGV